MLSTARLPVSVTRVVEAYLNLLGRSREDFLRGLYLVGSVALDDYKQGSSDIDFVALVSGSMNVARLAQLERAHVELRLLGGPLFDGFYVNRRVLHQAPAAGVKVPYSLGGIFHSDAAPSEMNPVTWHCLAQHGIAICGPYPAELGIAVDLTMLRRFLTTNLQGYWSKWAADCESALARTVLKEDAVAAELAWGVLGTSRIACTLATARIVSKTEAGRWALATYSSEWHRAIQDALAVRRGEIHSLPAMRFGPALDFVRFFITHSQPAT
jgi:hypothetical protein